MPLVQESFDPQATQPLPLAELPTAAVSAQPDVSFELIDLDLGAVPALPE